MPRAILLAALGIATLVAGCGPAPGAGSFSSDDFPFSFNYPSNWTLSQALPGVSGNGTVTVALREPLDQVQLTSFTMKKSIPEGETAIQSEVDEIFRRVARNSAGKPGKARAVEYNGARGFKFTLTYPASEQVKLRSRLTVLFSGKSQIAVNCQSTAENREQLMDGCDEILESLKFD